MKLTEKLNSILEAGNVRDGITYGNALTKDQAKKVSKSLEKKFTSIAMRQDVDIEFSATPDQNENKWYGVKLVLKNNMKPEPKNMSAFSKIKKELTQEAIKLVRDEQSK